MSGPPTMLIREPDEERTLVDPRGSKHDPSSEVTVFLVGSGSSSRAELPFEGSGRANATTHQRQDAADLTEAAPASSLCDGVKETIGGHGRLAPALGIALVLGLSAVAYQQWRVARALREAVVELSASASVSPVLDPIASADVQSGSPKGRIVRHSRVQALETHERQALEDRGASLVGSNNFSDALSHYQMLADLFPEETTFRDVVTVLHSKLRCGRSHDPSSPTCP
ncbi:MAG: hypothetical protein WCE62_21195 [Polyangiales bacterium]